MSKEYYVDNKEFLKELTKYRQAVHKAKKLGKPKPQIPQYVAECIMKIAEKFSHNYKFLSYSFRDEMVADAIENCIRYIDNFDPSKLDRNGKVNPFAYFTQIVYYAFLRRIQREKKELYIKYKFAETTGILDENELNENEDGQFRQFEMYSNISEYIERYEESQKKRKIKKSPFDEILPEETLPEDVDDEENDK